MKYKHLISFAVFSLCITVASIGFAQDGTFDNLNLDGDNSANAQTTIRFKTNSGATKYAIFTFNNRMEIDTDTNTAAGQAVWALRESAVQGSVVIDGDGFGIGTNVGPSDGTLTVRSNAGGAYQKANILVDETDSVVSQRQLLRLKNNGGSRITMENSSTGQTYEVRTDNQNNFAIGPAGNDKLIIFEDAKDQTLNLGSLGVGIGTDTPMHMLHLRTDGVEYDTALVLVENAQPTVATRDMFRLVNNGGSRFRLSNTDTGTDWLFQASDADVFSIKTNLVGGPSFRLKSDGTMQMGLIGGGNNLTLDPLGNLSIKGMLTQPSDRNMKENFKEVDPQEVLQKLVSIPITTWNFKTNRNVTHLGPVAQDFYAQFELGENDRTIAPLDTVGVSFAAIQGLNQKLQQQQKQIETLESSLKEQEKAFALRLERLEAIVSTLDIQGDTTVATNTESTTLDQTVATLAADSQY